MESRKHYYTSTTRWCGQQSMRWRVLSWPSLTSAMVGVTSLVILGKCNSFVTHLYCSSKFSSFIYDIVCLHVIWFVFNYVLDIIFFDKLVSIFVIVYTIPLITNECLFLEPTCCTHSCYSCKQCCSAAWEQPSNINVYWI